MPELPEVETIRCSLLGNVGAVIKDIEFRRTDIIKLQDFEPASVIGYYIRDIRRRGKYLILDLEPGYTLVVHLGMTGRFYMQNEDTEISEPHVHMIVYLDNGYKLVYMDARRFGGVRFLTDPECIFCRMGREPLSAEFTDRYLQEICRDRKVAIKTLLLNQNCIAGIGNIYADEALFDARIRPDRPAGTLRPAEIKRLRKAIVKVLQASIAQRGTTFRDFRDGYNKSGEFQELLQVYGKNGCPCNICGQTLKKEIIGGRSSHFCEHCQK
jgi:formamidopyrimidine-DNA glycosylase